MPKPERLAPVCPGILVVTSPSITLASLRVKEPVTSSVERSALLIKRFSIIAALAGRSAVIELLVSEAPVNVRLVAWPKYKGILISALEDAPTPDVKVTVPDISPIDALCSGSWAKKVGEPRPYSSLVNKTLLSAMFVASPSFNSGNVMTCSEIVTSAEDVAPIPAPVFISVIPESPLKLIVLLGRSEVTVPPVMLESVRIMELLSFLAFTMTSSKIIVSSVVSRAGILALIESLVNLASLILRELRLTFCFGTVIDTSVSTSEIIEVPEPTSSFPASMVAFPAISFRVALLLGKSAVREPLFRAALVSSI